VRAPAPLAAPLKEFSKNFKKLEKGGPEKNWCLHPNKRGPELRGSLLGTKPKKAFIIQLVISSIIRLNPSLITQHPSPFYYCKFVAVFEANLLRLA
jgi:hypothetical protein